MTVVSLVLVEHAKKEGAKVCEHGVEGFSYSPVGVIDGIPSHQEVQDQPLGAVADIAAVSAICNDARIIGNDDSNSEQDSTTRKPYKRVGEPTEAALCVLAEKLGGVASALTDAAAAVPSALASANVNAWRTYNPRLATLEFSRDRKSMSVLCSVPKVYTSPEQGSVKIKPKRPGNRLLVKGAPNLLIERCTHVKYRDGTVVRMTGHLRREIEAKVSELATRPLRCLALAVKESKQLEDSLRRFSPKDDREVARHPLLADSSNYRSIESGLTLVGIVGIKDPARPGVADSIDLCTRAGIRVMMITGDAKDTAIAIARDVHIFPTESEADGTKLKAYEGREFFAKPREEQLEILKEDNIVFCRAEPSDKQKLIKMLQSLNEVTCMTGDGVVSQRISQFVCRKSTKLTHCCAWYLRMTHQHCSRHPLVLPWVLRAQKCRKKRRIWCWRTTTFRLLSALWKKGGEFTTICKHSFAF
jgi:P-type Ca2+ transporter type 2C